MLPAEDKYEQPLAPTATTLLIQQPLYDIEGHPVSYVNNCEVVAY